MLFIDREVALPAKYEVRRNGSNAYVYITLSSQRVGGKLKHHRLNVGKLKEADDGLSSLIPNSNYYEHFGKALPALSSVRTRGRPRKTRISTYSEMPDGSVLGFGYGIACLHLAKQNGLMKLLESLSPGPHAAELFALASYYAVGDYGGLTGIEHFMRRQMNFCTDILTPQRGSEIYREITPEYRHRFFKAWVKARRERLVCYDVTSISTYSEKLIQASYGYNRDKEKLRQINLGLFSTLEKGIPLFYTSYNGNINDFTNYPYVLKQATEVGIEPGFKVVMDGAFSEKKDIDFSSMKGVDFIVGAPVDHCPGTREELLRWRRESTAASDLLNGWADDVASAEKPFTISGTAGRLMMYRFGDAKNDQEQNLRLSIKRLHADLAEKQEKGKVPRRQGFYKPFFEIKAEDADASFAFQLNEKAVNEELELCGCMALFTNDEEISAEKCLRLYREKDVVEKNFAELKNDICQERLFVGTSAGKDGKLFVLFLALILRKALTLKVEKWIEKNRSSVRAVIDMLADIEVRRFQDQWILEKALTKQQKELVKLLDLPIQRLELVSSGQR